MDKVIDANDVFTIIRKLRNVIPDLFEKRTHGHSMISEVLKYDFEKEKYKEPYKHLYERYTLSQSSFESAKLDLINEKNTENEALITEITERIVNLEEQRNQLKNKLTAMPQKFADEYKKIYCLGDSIMESLFSIGNERSELESGWRAVQDMAVFKCIIYLLFYYANIYDDVYKLNSCREWPKNSDSKIKLFKSFLQSCIDYIEYIDTQLEYIDTQLEITPKIRGISKYIIPNITHNEFELIKQAVKNKNEKCTLKEYFKKLPYVDKLCFYILDRNSISSANVGKDGQLCPFIGFKRKSSSWKRISKGLKARGETMKNIIAGPTNKNAIIQKYEKNMEDIFDKYVKNYNKLQDIVANEENEDGWKTTDQPFSTKWATADTTNNCRSIFIQKFKDSQDDTEFLCYCLLLQEYLKNEKKSHDVVLNDYINDTISTLKHTNLDKNIKCNDYNNNLPETGKYILLSIIKEHSTNGGNKSTRKTRKCVSKKERKSKKCK
jgi:hypothetical protein